MDSNPCRSERQSNGQRIWPSTFGRSRDRRQYCQRPGQLKAGRGHRQVGQNVILMVLSMSIGRELQELCFGTKMVTLFRAALNGMETA